MTAFRWMRFLALMPFVVGCVVLGLAGTAGAVDEQMLERMEQIIKQQQAQIEAQAKALENSTWVGKDFVEQSRAMHYGERDHAAIHGEATVQEAKELLEEGVPVAPLPLPVAPPDDVN